MSASKQKGTKWETEIVNYLRENGFVVERKALTGNQDLGDISGVAGWTIQAKNQNALDLAGWMDQTETQRRNSGDPFGVLVIRRRMKPVSMAYAVLPLEQMLDPMRMLG